MIAVILNPKSGSASDTDVLEEKIRTALPQAEVVIGCAAGDARRDALAAAERGCGTIIAAGGDGTLNEVLNGVMSQPRNVHLGLLPLGTGNDFARAIRMPTDVDEALKVLAGGMTRPIDVVRMPGVLETRYFLNVSAGGFSGAVSEKLTPELKATWGPLSYLRGMIETLPEMTAYDCELTFDDEPPSQLRLYNLVIANAPYVAKGVPVAPNADPSDGWLDVVGIRECAVAQRALLTPLVLAGKHLGMESVLSRRAKRISVGAAPAMPFNTDGEMVGETPWTFEIMPAAIEMIAAPEAQSA